MTNYSVLNQKGIIMKKALIIVISVIVILAAVIGIGIASGALAVTPNSDGQSGVQVYTEEQK